MQAKIVEDLCPTLSNKGDILIEGIQVAIPVLK